MLIYVVFWAGLAAPVLAIGLALYRVITARPLAGRALWTGVAIAVLLAPFAVLAGLMGRALLFGFVFALIGCAAALMFGVTLQLLLERPIARWAPGLGLLGAATGFATVLLFRLSRDLPLTPYVHRRSGGGFIGTYTESPAHVSYLVPFALVLLGFAAARSVGMPRSWLAVAAAIAAFAFTLFLYWQLRV